MFAPRPARLFAAALWLAAPALLEFAAEPQTGLPIFCGGAANPSYRAMFVAALAGVGLAELALMRRPPRGFDALGLFETLLAAAIAAGAAGIGRPLPALAWGLGAVLLALTRSGRVEPARRSHGVGLLRAGLLGLALVFVAFPVLQPWSGPPEPFVRWRPYTLDGEFVWRAIFLSYALGMAAAAVDPRGAGRDFLLALAFSGAIHAATMAADALSPGGANGGAEHFYGDILGWSVIAAFGLWGWRRAGAERQGEVAAPRSALGADA